MRAALATVILLSVAGVVGQRGRAPATRPSSGVLTADAARMAILAAEDSRLAIPDNLHTPGIDALRARQMEDIRRLLELTRSMEPATQSAAIRALGRLERRELIPDLLQFVTRGPTAEAANAVAQAFRGEPLPADTAGDQVSAAFDALVQVGVVPLDQRRSPGPVGVVARSIGRLPYVRADQVQAADAFLLSVLRTIDREPALRGELVDVARSIETLARVHGRLALPAPDTIDELRALVASRRRTYDHAVRLAAMEALLAARGVDPETLRIAAGAVNPPDSAALMQLRRLAAVVLSGSAVPLPPTERTELVTTLLSDRWSIVRIEAVRAWARRETAENGCQRLLDALKDPSLAVALASIDALGDQCKDDQGVTDRLTTEARPPQPDDWHLAAHALVALARRAPARVFIPLLAGHVQHPTWQVRMYAARAAAATDELSALERLAFDPEDNVRAATLAPLRRLKGEDAEPYFVAALARSDYQLLRAAAIELKGMKPTTQLSSGLLDALRRVTAQQKETSRDTRLALLERLEELGARDQAGALQPLLRDFDIAVAHRAAALIEHWTGRAQEIDPQLLPRPALPSPAELSMPPARVKLKSGLVFYIHLNGRVAPLAVARFVRLAAAGYYNGLTIHRVVPDFVVQGGSPGANEYAGDSLYLRDEISLTSHARGVVGLSTRGRDTGDAQFFINLVDNPRLDFEYTAFGEASPMDVVDRIAEGGAIAAITFEKEGKSRDQKN